MESSEDSQEELQYSHLKAWVQKIFDRVTAGPYQKSFSKFKDPIKQMEVVIMHKYFWQSWKNLYLLLMNFKMKMRYSKDLKSAHRNVW